ncbi:MAG TPA: LytTR family DNA-binding domain-containing protein [Prolixibacteraceae bacterium]|nr:LytTR family DNA-binding domain-containing protein [Prolixibacteraceae bacterium]
MNVRQPVPEYLTNRKNTIIQITFTAVFAYVFINIYRPFGYDDWYKINEWKLLVASGVVVLLGMITIILTRLGMFILKKNHEITLAVYLFIIFAEIILLGAFYTSLEVFILKDQRPPLQLMFNAVQNTSLILLIPYALSILFFAWSDIKRKFEQLVSQFREPADVFIPFRDEKGILRLTLRSLDVLYLQASDNYVTIHYTDRERKKTYLIRNNLKKMEKEFREYPLYRCHRSFAVNIKNIHMVRKTGKGYELVIPSADKESIPLSVSYEKKILDLLKIKQ